MNRKLESVDFALDEMPGEELHQILHAFREEAPVMPTRFLGLPSFVITSHEALLDAFMDTESFPPHRMYQAAFEPAIGESFISMESPDRHRVFRRLATPAFRSRAIASYEKEGMVDLAHELIDDFGEKEIVELMAQYAARFPYLMITRLLGLPRDREAEFHVWAQALLRFRDDPVAARKAGEELTRFLAPIVEDRRREPRNDVISELVNAEVEGRGLSDEEIYSHVRLLIPTGGETTHGSLGNLFYALLTQPDAWSTIRDDPARIPDAVDELLRWETPIAVLPRISASRPIEFHGVEIPADSWVLFAMAGANRDPAMHADPDRFDLDRADKDGLTFGKGVKSCPGMHLAKKNMCVATRALVERMPGIELTDLESAIPRRSVLRCPEALQARRSG